jgi:DNA repair photolyase
VLQPDDDRPVPTFCLDGLAPRDRALFDGLSPTEATAVYTYLFTHPAAGGLPRLRSRAIGLYDPFCDRRRHPMGVLWQASPYACCSHACAYCYARSYLTRFGGGGTLKRGFPAAFVRCLDELQRLGVPPRHLSMANSSDVLQRRLEREHRTTLVMLEEVARRPGLFGSVGVLTKDPGVLLDDDRYVAALRPTRAEVQISLAFFRDEPAACIEPGAPPPSERRAVAERLAALGVRVVLRLDPLFPRGVPGCTEFQSQHEDLLPLLEWAGRIGVEYVITSAMKLPYRRNTVPEFHKAVLPAFPIVRGNCRRMASDLEQCLIEEVRNLGASVGLPADHCFANILRRAAAAPQCR